MFPNFNVASPLVLPMRIGRTVPHDKYGHKVETAKKKKKFTGSSLDIFVLLSIESLRHASSRYVSTAFGFIIFIYQ